MTETDYNAIKADNVAKITEQVDTQKDVPTKKTPIVTNVVEKKPGLIQRLVNVTAGPDGFRRIGSYIGHEVIAPAIRDMIAGGAKTAIDMFFYRDGNAPVNNYTRSTQSHYGRANRTNYSAQYNRQPQQPNYAPMERMVDVGLYVIPDRNQALEVLNSLRMELDKFGQVSVADYYEYIGVESDYTKQTYGWVDLHTARILPTRGGFYIEFPPADVL